MSKTSVVRSERRAGSSPSYYAYVKPAFRRGFAIELIPYQTNGIISRPLWNTKNHVIRIIPGYDPTTGEIYHQNVKVNEYSDDGSQIDYLSDTFWQANTLQNFGEQRQTFISDYEPGSADAERWGGDTALHVFIRNLMTAVQGKRKSRFSATEEMKRWADNRQGIVRYPRTSLLMQALTFTVNDRDSADKDGNPIVDEDGEILPLLAVVSVDGKQTLNALLTALVEPANPGEPLNAITNNKYGGMAEAEGNKLFLNHVTDPQTGFNFLRPSVQRPGKGWTPTPYPLDTEIIKSLWHPWEDLLQFLSADEQCRLLATEFGADTVNYLVGTDPTYSSYAMPDEIARVGYGRYTKFVGVHDVAQTVRVSEPASAASIGANTPKKATGFGLPKAAAKPAESKPVVSSGLTAAVQIDTEKLRSEVAKIRAAASPKRAVPSIEEQAAAAEELLSGVADEDPADIGL